MRGPVDRIAAFVEDLVRNRRPCRFKASPEEMDALGAAAELAAARPGADLPSGHFIARLGRQLRSQMEPPPAHEPVTRRALLRTAGLAAAERILALTPLLSLWITDIGRMYPPYLLWGRSVVRLAIAALLYWLSPREARRGACREFLKSDLSAAG